MKSACNPLEPPATRPTRFITLEKSRLSYLDNLRFSLVALVICHHANAAYGSPGGGTTSFTSPVEEKTTGYNQTYSGYCAFHLQCPLTDQQRM